MKDEQKKKEKFKRYGIADKDLKMVSGGAGDCTYGIIISSACIGCGNCADVCCVHCIKMVGGTMPVVSNADCICCEKCIGCCPVSAITMIE